MSAKSSLGLVSFLMVAVLLAVGVTAIMPAGAMAAGASISGIITEAGTGTLLDSVRVSVYDAQTGAYIKMDYSDLGLYTIDGLENGKQYFLNFFSDANMKHITTYYSNAKYFSEATPVTATNAGTVGIDVQMSTGATAITGTVTDAVTGKPLADCMVGVWDSSLSGSSGDPSGPSIQSEHADEQGRYTIGGLDPTVNYKVSYQSTGFEWAYYDINCWNWDDAALVRGNKTGVDIGLLPVGWYLAEGSTAWGFSDYMNIENPNDSEITVTITYMPAGAAPIEKTVSLPASSQTTINPADDLGEKDFSTLVRTPDQSKPIAVDRTMFWTGTGASSPEGHSSVGIDLPGRTWFLPEGSSAWGFESWLLIQNPNNTEANCEVTYMIEGENPQKIVHTVPENSRASFSMTDDIGNKDASIMVSSDIPVIPERAMYKNNRREGHDSIGTLSPSEDYYLPEGTTAWGFTTYVLVQNPNDAPADIAITYMTPEGPREHPVFSMPENSRKTIRVNDISPANGYPIDVSNTDFSTKVHGSLPIIAERAMYWESGSGEACHDSIGLVFPYTTFLLPDGQTSEGRETWTLVQNPNDTEVTVEISYLTPSGKGNVTFEEKVPANSRRTFSMADKLPDTRAAVMVKSKTDGAPVMVERAMYWNSRGAGTDTIGGGSWF